RHILRIFMADSALSAGMATAIGSLPHRDPHAAAALVLRCIPELPAAPELPMRSPLEGVIAQWAHAVPNIHVAPDGTLHLTGPMEAAMPIWPEFDAAAPAGLLTFLDVAAAAPRPPARVKVQVVGPLTLGLALADLGVRVSIAFPLAARVAQEWARA